MPVFIKSLEEKRVMHIIENIFLIRRHVIAKPGSLVKNPG